MTFVRFVRRHPIPTAVTLVVAAFAFPVAAPVAIGALAGVVILKALDALFRL